MKLRSGFTYSFSEKDNNTKYSSKTVIAVCYKDYKANPASPKKIIARRRPVAKSKKPITEKPITEKPVINIKKNINCAICQEAIKTGDTICSCSVKNINKHCFHRKCLGLWFKELRLSGKSRTCPYCATSIRSGIKYIKIK